MGDKQIVYITRYALSSGIIEAEVIEIIERNRMCAVVWKGGINNRNHFFGDDWHTDLESAHKKAESMRVKRIASLKKQIVNLEKMLF
jgi:hypothetical protein